MHAKRKRSIVKALTWRVIGTLTLALVVYFFTEKPVLSVSLSVIDIVSNILLYYFHEKLWDQTDWNRFPFKDFFRSSKKRMLAKTATWRVLASSYILIVAIIFTKRPILSANIVLIDTLLNIVEYYGHEWLWNYMKWGRRRKME